MLDSLLLRLNCVLSGHKPKRVDNPFGFDDCELVVCERCDKVLKINLDVVTPKGQAASAFRRYSTDLF